MSDKMMVFSGRMIYFVLMKNNGGKLTAGVRVNICRPGFGASCAMCCGSHNYRASRDAISALFAQRAEVVLRYNPSYLVRKMTASRSNLTGSYYVNRQDEPFTPALPALFEDCPQCPFVGHTDRSGHVGCLLYPEDHPPELRHECFQSYRGKVFTCRAGEVLSDEEIQYAARLTGDWYYYSVLIHDEGMLQRLMRLWPDPGDVPEGERERMREALNKRVTRDRSLHMVHSYFS